MTLAKAIEILEEEIAGMVKAGGGDWHDAILLGIQALKEIKRADQICRDLIPDLLPGETKK